MSSKNQWNLLLKSVEEWNHWRQQEPSLTIDLSCADLNQINLGKANISHANLCQADLSETNLRRANLSHSALRRATLVKANGYKLDLHSADLRRATLRRIQLKHANLNDARLCGADLYGAELTGANLAGAKLIGANLTGADLTKANLVQTDLTGANLKGANLTGANLTEAVLINCDLTATIWSEATLSKAQFRNNLGVTDVNQAAMSSLDAHFLPELPKRQRNAYHLLMFRDIHGQRLIHLDANTYRIGRDAKADIQLSDQTVSRYHAVLLRVDSPDQQCFYRIVDGDGRGNMSCNGLRVNRVACRSHNLNPGDHIKVGRTLLEYRIQEFTRAELTQYLEVMNRPGIPSSLDLSIRGTMHQLHYESKNVST